jgi:hypothetical protein
MFQEAYVTEFCASIAAHLWGAIVSKDDRICNGDQSFITEDYDAIMHTVSRHTGEASGLRG